MVNIPQGEYGIHMEKPNGKFSGGVILNGMKYVTKNS